MASQSGVPGHQAQRLLARDALDPWPGWPTLALMHCDDPAPDTDPLLNHPVRGRGQRLACSELGQERISHFDSVAHLP